MPRFDPIDVHRFGDVFYNPLAQVLKAGIDLVPHLAISVLREADAAGLSQSLKTNRQIHAVAVDVIVFENNVPKGYAGPKDETPLLRQLSFAVAPALLQRDGAFHGIDR